MNRDLEARRRQDAMDRVERAAATGGTISSTDAKLVLSTAREALFTLGLRVMVEQAIMLAEVRREADDGKGGAE